MEEECDYAKTLNKKCLCYVVDEDHPWPPALMDVEEKREALARFKQKVATLVRSKFTTPDNLAKQVAADVAREMAPERSRDSVGGLLQVNWDALSPELQVIFLDAYKRAKEGSRDGVVATRHVFAALVSSANSSGILMHQMDKKIIEDIRKDSEPPIETDDAVALAQVFGHEQPFSHCVVSSLDRLLPTHSDRDRLLAVELAADLLINGRGKSVEKFRRANIDGAAVNHLMRHAKSIAGDRSRILAAIGKFTDAEIATIAYATGLKLELGLEGHDLCESVVTAATDQQRLDVLAGELLRRKQESLL